MIKNLLIWEIEREYLRASRGGSGELSDDGVDFFHRVIRQSHPIFRADNRQADEAIVVITIVAREYVFRGVGAAVGSEDSWGTKSHGEGSLDGFHSRAMQSVKKSVQININTINNISRCLGKRKGHGDQRGLVREWMICRL